MNFKLSLKDWNLPQNILNKKILLLPNVIIITPTIVPYFVLLNNSFDILAD